MRSECCHSGTPAGVPGKSGQGRTAGENTSPAGQRLVRHFCSPTEELRSEASGQRDGTSIWRLQGQLAPADGLGPLEGQRREESRCDNLECGAFPPLLFFGSDRRNKAAEKRRTPIEGHPYGAAERGVRPALSVAVTAENRQSSWFPSTRWLISSKLMARAAREEGKCCAAAWPSRC
jgi:hypothetical protein